MSRAFRIYLTDGDSWSLVSNCSLGVEDGHLIVYKGDRYIISHVYSPGWWKYVVEIEPGSDGLFGEINE